MRKKISSRVVRSIPLSKSSEGLRHSSRSNDKHHKIGDVVAETPTGFPSAPSRGQVYPCESRGDGLQNWVPGKKYVWEGPEPSANVQVKHSSNPITYTDRMGITRVSIDDGLTAQILDFYV